MATYLRLFDPTQQFQLKNGAINVAGLLKVKLEGTDDFADIYDEDGTQLAQPVILDNNGRSKGLFVDSSRVYWLEVDDRDGYELFTIRKMTPCGGGGGSLGKEYSVISSDGTVDVSTYGNAGTTVFDLSIATEDEASKWGGMLLGASSVSGSGDWEALPVVSTEGIVAYDYGWTATKDCMADIAASVEMTSGDQGALNTLDVKCVFYVDGNIAYEETGMLDPSENSGRVCFEFKGDVDEGKKVDCILYVRCSQALTLGLVGRALYNEECDGIVGSGGGGGGGSYIPGQYIDISTANVISVTGLQPAGAYVYKSDISAQSSVWDTVTGKQDTLSFGYDGPVISSINGSALAGGGINLSAGDYIDISGNVISVTGLQPSGDYAYNSSLSSKMDSTASSLFQTSGDYAYNSSVSSKLDASASSLFQPSGDYAYNSSVSSKVEQSAFDQCCSSMSAKVSALETGKLDNSASSLFSGYVEKSSISAESANWNEVSAKLDESAFTSYTATAAQFTGVTTDSSLTGDGLTSSPLGVNRMELDFDSSITTSVTGNTATVGVNTAILSGFQYASAMTAYQPSGDYAYNSAVSGKADQSSLDDCCSAMSSEVSALKTDVSSLSSTVSSLTGTYLEQSASAMFALSSQAFTGVTTDGTLTGDGTVGSALGVNRMELDFDSSMSTSVTGNTATVGVNAAILSGKLDTSAQVVTAIGVAAGALSSINNYGLSAGTANSAGTALYDSAGRTLTSMATKAEASGIAMAYAASAVSSVSAEYYSTSNPSGFITGVDLSPYQTTAGMSAYAYESSNSAKLDATAFSTVSGNFLTSETVTALGDDGVYITSINGSALAAGVDSATVSAIASSYAESAASGKQDSSGMSAYAYESSNSAKLDSTAFSTVSGTFLTSVDLTPYQLTADMSGYLQTGESSNYLLTSQSGMFQPSGYYLTTADIGIGEI